MECLLLFSFNWCTCTYQIRINEIMVLRVTAANLYIRRDGVKCLSNLLHVLV